MTTEVSRPPAPTSRPETTDCNIIVVNEADDKKYKMVIRGVLSKISVAKLKTYLANACGIPPQHQVLFFNGDVLSDTSTCADSGLTPNCVVRLRELSAAPPPPVVHTPSMTTVVSPAVTSIHLEDTIIPTPTNPPTNTVVLTPPSRRPSAAIVAPPPQPSSIHQQQQQQQQHSSRPTTPPPQSNISSSGIPSRLTPRQPQSNHALQQDLVGRQRQLEFSAYVAGATPPPATFMRESNPHSLTPSSVTMLNQTPLHFQQQQQSFTPSSYQPVHASFTSLQPQAHTMAVRNLQEFSSHLGCRPPLQFDANHTCVVNVEEKYTLLITFDAVTERLYLYTTLLTRIPQEPERKIRLYEAILEGAVLGREMAGGGVGVNQNNGLVILSSSIDLRHSDCMALRDLVPTFAECAVRWKRIVTEIVS